MASFRRDLGSGAFFFEALLRFARFEVHVGARAPPAEAGLAPDIHLGALPLLRP